jgi:hypothetical protein
VVGEAGMVQVVRTHVRRVIEQQVFAGRAELLAQVSSVQVVSGPVTFLHLAMGPSADAASEFQDGPIPGQPASSSGTRWSSS